MSEERNDTKFIPAFTAPDYRILVIDDNAVMLRMVQGLLRPYGCTADMVMSGAAALDRLKEQPAYDMLLVDYRMPDMDGIEILGQVRSNFGEYGKTVVAVALTADEGEDAGVMFARAGFQEYLSKPPTPPRLCELLNRYVPENKKVMRVMENVHRQDKKDMPQSLRQLRASGIDVESGLRRCGGVDEYIRILGLVAADTGSRMELFGKYICEGDYKLYEIEVHALKSVTAAIGAWKQSEIAAEHEAAVKNADYDFVKCGCEKLLNSCHVLLNQIQRVLDKEGDRLHNNIGQIKRRIDGGKLIQMLEEAADGLADFRRKDAGRILEELSEYELSAEVESAVKRAREKYELYEDEEAEELLRSCMYSRNLLLTNHSG